MPRRRTSSKPLGKPGDPLPWQTLPPDTPYGCRSRYVGRTVPGKRGGAVTACATPNAARPREGQFWLGPPVAGIGQPVRKATVRERFRKRGRVATPAADIELQAADAGRDPYHVPYPPGLEFPHRPGSSRCDPEHPVWRGHAAAVAAAAAAIRAGSGPDATPEEHARALYDALARTRDFGAWADAEAACLAEFAGRRRARVRGAGESTARAAARRRAEALAAGEDVTGAEYREGRRGGEGLRKAARRR